MSLSYLLKENDLHINCGTMECSDCNIGGNVSWNDCDSNICHIGHGYFGNLDVSGALTCNTLNFTDISCNNVDTVTEKIDDDYIRLSKTGISIAGKQDGTQFPLIKMTGTSWFGSTPQGLQIYPSAANCVAIGVGVSNNRHEVIDQTGSILKIGDIGNYTDTLFIDTRSTEKTVYTDNVKLSPSGLYIGTSPSNEYTNFTMTGSNWGANPAIALRILPFSDGSLYFQTGTASNKYEPEVNSTSILKFTGLSGVNETLTLDITTQTTTAQTTNINGQLTTNNNVVMNNIPQTYDYTMNNVVINPINNQLFFKNSETYRLIRSNSSFLVADDNVEHPIENFYDPTPYKYSDNDSDRLFDNDSSGKISINKDSFLCNVNVNLLSDTPNHRGNFIIRCQNQDGEIIFRQTCYYETTYEANISFSFDYYVQTAGWILFTIQSEIQFKFQEKSQISLFRKGGISLI